MMMMIMLMMIMTLEEFGTDALVRKMQIEYKRLLYFQSFFLRKILFKFNEFCSELCSPRSTHSGYQT